MEHPGSHIPSAMAPPPVPPLTTYRRFRNSLGSLPAGYLKEILEKIAKADWDELEKIQVRPLDPHGTTYVEKLLKALDDGASHPQNRKDLYNTAGDVLSVKVA
ncbi:hypothetical protein JCM11491_005788 [Sporobolomyces phaffii]